MLNEAVNVLLITMFGGVILFCHSQLAPEHFQKYVYSPTMEQWEQFKTEQTK